MKVKYYVDMDGVLAVWNQNASEEDTHQHGYFASREPEPSAIGLVRILKENGHDISILSSVYEDDHSADDKRKWLDKVGLSDIPQIFVPYGADKADYIEDADDFLPVLIDDYSKNLYVWEEKYGIAFKFFNGVNNKPRFRVVNNVLEIESDKWSGYSIDNRMTPEKMYIIVKSISEAIAA